MAGVAQWVQWNGVAGAARAFQCDAGHDVPSEDAVIRLPSGANGHDVPLADAVVRRP